MNAGKQWKLEDGGFRRKPACKFTNKYSYAFKK